MADGKANGGKKKKKVAKPASTAGATSVQKATATKAAVKVSTYEKLLSLRQARDEAQADVLHAEFELSTALNVANLSGSKGADIDELRRNLRAAREVASQSMQDFQIAKFESRPSGHK